MVTTTWGAHKGVVTISSWVVTTRGSDWDSDWAEFGQSLWCRAVSCRVLFAAILEAKVCELCGPFAKKSLVGTRLCFFVVTILGATKHP